MRAVEGDGGFSWFWWAAPLDPLVVGWSSFSASHPSLTTDRSLFDKLIADLLQVIGAESCTVKNWAFQPYRRSAPIFDGCRVRLPVPQRLSRRSRDTLRDERTTCPTISTGVCYLQNVKI